MAAKNTKNKTSLDASADSVVCLDPKMLQLLVCPLTKQGLQLSADKSELKSISARLAYPIRGGVPILLPSEARSLDDEEL